MFACPLVVPTAERRNGNNSGLADMVVAELPGTEWDQNKKRSKIGGVKITLDGSPQGRTSFLTTPCLVGGPGGETD